MDKPIAAFFLNIFPKKTVKCGLNMKKSSIQKRIFIQMFDSSNAFSTFAARF